MDLLIVSLGFVNPSTMQAADYARDRVVQRFGQRGHGRPSRQT